MSNADKARPEITINCGGRDRAFKLTMNSFCLIEQQLGSEKHWSQHMNLLNLSSTHARLLFWAGLHSDAKKHKESLSLEQVGEWMDEVENLSDILIEGLRRALPALDKAISEIEQAQKAQEEKSEEGK